MPEQSPLRLGRRTFGPGEPVVMAIVNRTPDSFYDRGRTYALDAALARVDQVVDDPAGDHDWGISATVDLTESNAAGVAVVRVTAVGML